MYNKILIRYGELVLKKKNRKSFINQLSNNITHIVGTAPEVEFDRMYLPYSLKNLEQLNFVFGISSYSPVIITNNDLKEFQNTILKLIKPSTKTFKIQARRNYKKFEYTSDQLNNVLGGYVLKNTNLKVDVHNPNQTFYIEIRNKQTYIFSDYISGLGGLPVGISGRALHLISGGFDSPVAAFLMMKRGVKLDFLTFLTPPQTDEKTVSKIKNLVQILNKYQISSNLLMANFSHLLNYISFISKQSYKINLMRRSFYRTAEKIALRYGQLAISNGENLGQVASQTLESMNTIGWVIKLPILRPLLTYDKNEIIQIARKINTHDISIIATNETCELFAPKDPVTKPTIVQAELLENELSMITQLEEELINEKITIMKVRVNET
ncbi:thiamine biosynthesis protein ThiI [Mycoplasmopsis mustelae]|uniref:Probable tRNA sulfurtransferase n=1 Tax=Mycoplasmopsis mustelae TaxID=171289 RepID=A0A4R7UEX7_9BACT|nr:tRNA uracil 4-sulfurtransferase ThiI [Mycoplasmopsis mustelae]TDV24461.1 thiamine biosynthesis protein ThiI [Mycoplasmopsis mustelae]